MLGVDAEVRAARPPSAGWAAPSTSTRSPTSWPTTRRAAAARRCPACWPTWTPPRWWRTGWRPPRSTVAHGPRPDPHRARRQGPGVAGRRRAAPERAGVPVDRVDADLAHRRRPTCRRCCAATAPPLGAHGVPVLDTSDVNDRKAVVGQDHPTTSAGSTSAGSTRSAGCCTWRSPAPRTRCCCPVTTGAPPKPSRAGRRSSCCELKDIIDDSAAAGDPCGVVEHWAPAPADGEPNPLRDKRHRGGLARRPGGRAPRRRGARRRVGRAARMAGAARPTPARTPTAGPPTSTRCSPSATARRTPAAPTLPAAAVGQQPGRARPRPGRRGAPAAPPAAGPARPACLAGHRLSRLGAAVLRRRAAVRPRRPARRGRRRAGRADAEELAELQAAFMASPWAARTPVDVEVPFEMVDRRHGGAGPHRRGVRRRRRRRHRGRLEDRRPAGRRRKPRGTPRFSSRVYRLAWAALHGLPGVVGARGVPLRAQRAHRRPRRRCPAPTNWSRCWSAA